MNIKKTLLIMCALLSQTAIAQTTLNKDYNKFEKSFFSEINYPPYLINNCSPIACLIKIQTDAIGKVSDISLSDSADTLFRKEFEQNKHKLDTGSLEVYLKGEFGGNPNHVYLIPFYYSLYQMPCPNQVIEINILRNYYKFNGKQLTESTIVLSPLDHKIKVQQ